MRFAYDLIAVAFTPRAVQAHAESNHSIAVHPCGRHQRIGAAMATECAHRVAAAPTIAMNAGLRVIALRCRGGYARDRGHYVVYSSGVLHHTERPRVAA